MNTETFEPATEPIAQPPADEHPVHLARCAECGFAVRYQPTNGAAYVLMDMQDRTLGIGEHNRPTCPDGHGEMEIADDRLPIEQAITQTAERIDATTQRLPFPSPPFNYEGVLHALCEKRSTIAALEKRVEDRRDLLKKAKDDLDEANAELERVDRHVAGRANRIGCTRSRDGKPQRRPVIRRTRRSCAARGSSRILTSGARCVAHQSRPRTTTWPTRHAIARSISTRSSA
jgi:hypothetical protein